MASNKNVEIEPCSSKQAGEDLGNIKKSADFGIKTGKENNVLAECTDTIATNSACLIKQITLLDKNISNLNQSNLSITNLTQPEHSQDVEELTTDVRNNSNDSDSLPDSDEEKENDLQGTDKNETLILLIKHDNYSVACYKDNDVPDTIEKKETSPEEIKTPFREQYKKGQEETSTACNVLKSNVHTEQKASTSHDTVVISNAETNMDLLITAMEQQCQGTFSRNLKGKPKKLSAIKILRSSFRCTICSHVVSSKLSLMCHIANNHDVEKNKCFTCNRVFGQFFQMKWHVAFFHSRGTFSCCVCSGSNHCDKQNILVRKP